MAKESMKAREVKRAKLVAKYAEKRAALKKIVNTVCIIVANLLDVQKVICVSSEFHVYNSVKWLQTV